MFHTLKRKTVFHHAAKHEPVNAEFDNLQQSLDNVSKALHAALTDVEQAENSWKELADNAGHFSSGLHTLYPTDDELRTLFKTSLEAVEEPLKKDMLQVGEATSQVKAIERMVRAYLTEIKTLHGEYAKVDVARKDYGMYQAKVDKLGKKHTESDKQNRNLEKLENAKATYESVLEGIIHRMKTTYEKAPSMFRAAYVAYWLYHSQMTKVVGKHFKSSFDYANLHADGLFRQSETAAHSGLDKKK